MHMGGLIYGASPGFDSKWTRCQDEMAYLERVLHIVERFRPTRKPLSPGSTFLPVTRLYDQINFFCARAQCEDPVFANHRIRGWKRYGLMHCWNRNDFPTVPARLRSAPYPHAPNGWRKDKGGPCELRIPTPTVFANFTHQILWHSGTGRRLRDILWTIAASEMMFFSMMAV